MMRRAFHSLAGAVLVSLVWSGAASAFWIKGETATFRGLDKITGRAGDFHAPVGEKTRFGPLEFDVQACFKRPPDETPETAVFVTVLDYGHSPQPGDEAELIFSGWMFASSPALNAIEHQVYDAWVLSCTARGERLPALQGAALVGAEDTPEKAASPAAATEAEAEAGAAPAGAPAEDGQ